LFAASVQGDQFGRIIFCQELIFKMTAIAQILATFFHGKSEALIFTKNGLGLTLGDFFTHSSGRPVLLLK
jgi:hypothetical protein